MAIICDTTMAFIRTRTAKGGTISTTLVEAYRDEQGRPRQRVLANLHGETDLLKALAKLAAQRADLRKEREKFLADYPHMEQFYATVTQNTLHGRKYSAEERKDIDRLMRQRKRLLKRFTTIENALATIEKEGGVIKKQCTARADEIQAAIQAHKKEVKDAEAHVLGMLLMESHRSQKAKRALRRLAPWTETPVLTKDMLAMLDEE
jgi:chromosome segregation ATPase